VRSALRLTACLVIGLGLAAGLAGCGKRGDPRLDPGKENRFPRSYPTPNVDE
jgi:hypothetical protein